jgi:hypothetical protein
MNFILAALFALLSLLPLAVFAQDFDLTSDSHNVIKCNFPNVESEPRLSAVIADPEWSQVVYLTREGEVLGDANLKWNLELKKTTPLAYVWSFNNQKGDSLLRIQELLTNPVRYYILGRKPGTYECYKQQTGRIPYYKRF